MKIKSRSFFLILFLGFLVLIFMKFFQDPIDDAKKEVTQDQIANSSQLVKNIKSKENQYTSDEVKEYMELTKKIFADKTDKEIFQRDGVAFKVRVVDQFGDPVVGAIYSATYQKEFDLQNYTIGSYSKKTDENGIFNVTINSKISGIWIAAQKKGYYQIQKLTQKYFVIIN